MKIVNLVTRFPMVLLAAAVVATTACEQTKSSSPLSPSIAGPIEGVVITPPAPMQPGPGQQVSDADQPLTITFANADSNSVRPYSLILQIASDAGFATIVYSQSGIAPAADGLNRVVLPARLQAGRSYFWRTKADDGANASDWSDPIQFEILQPIVIGVPNPVSPIGGVRVSSNTPLLRVQNGASSGPHGPLLYHFQGSLSPSFSPTVANVEVPQGNGETTFTVPGSPAPDTVVYWRVRITDGKNIGAWSRTESYRTPHAGTPTPGPGPGQSPGGGGSPKGCATSNGDALVSCIEQTYPSYLAAGVSHSQREANMAFLRDRIIESGICGGLDLAWNKKRGNGPHSIDALAWRTGGGVEVVDIGVGYDDTSRPLRLQWAIVAGPPGYDTYQPRPNCN